ncbi:MAG: FAD-dependent oxidoreductase [Polyangiaceae bacterium]
MSTPPPAPREPLEAAARRRLAIVGGGIGGVATAWLCDADWDISLFEARARIGGNCDSVTMDHLGRELVVDLGAQFFHPGTHPTYIALLDLLESSTASRVGGERVGAKYEIAAGLSVVPLAPPAGESVDPFFASTNLLKTPMHALDFAVYSVAARKMASSGDYSVTMASWVDGLRVSERFKSQVLLPWVTASEGHPLEETKRSSARAILELFAPSHPRNLLERATTWSSYAGLQANVDALARQCGRTSVHTQSPIVRIEKLGAEWFVHTGSGRSGPFDAVVINAPPWASKKLLGELAWAEGLVKILDRYEFRSHRLTVHTDPVYVHRNKKSWGLANVGVGAGGDPNTQNELSIWMGAALKKVKGQTVDVFKSWTTYRDRESKEVVAEREFQHSIKTPEMMDAARQLRSWQGREGLWFAGQFTSGIDLQESALRSAMDVAASLAPGSARLAALRRRKSTLARDGGRNPIAMWGGG